MTDARSSCGKTMIRTPCSVRQMCKKNTVFSQSARTSDIGEGSERGTDGLVTAAGSSLVTFMGVSLSTTVPAATMFSVLAPLSNGNNTGAERIDSVLRGALDEDAVSADVCSSVCLFWRYGSLSEPAALLGGWAADSNFEPNDSRRVLVLTLQEVIFGTTAIETLSVCSTQPTGPGSAFQTLSGGLGSNLGRHTCVMAPPSTRTFVQAV